MKVRLGTVEVDDFVRRAIRARYGQGGLATREEVRFIYMSSGEEVLTDIACEHQCELAGTDSSGFPMEVSDEEDA